MSGSLSGVFAAMPGSRSIIELPSFSDVRTFLLKHESYCNIDLPPYFQFTNLLDSVSKKLKDKNLSDFCIYKKKEKPQECEKKEKPQECDDVNYLILDNKDGRYDCVIPTFNISDRGKKNRSCCNCLN